MHEIIHLQLGPRANHLGTHQWNIAESMFSYDDNDTDYDVDHGVDWREGLGKEVSVRDQRGAGRGGELELTLDVRRGLMEL